MQYSKAKGKGKGRRSRRTGSMSQSATLSGLADPNRHQRWKIGYGDNAHRGKRYLNTTGKPRVLAWR